jgi:hypothetical protein
MAENIGRFKRITAQEAQQRIRATRKADAFRDQLRALFAAIKPLQHYELELEPKEKFASVRGRILRFAQENNIAGVHVRSGMQGKKATLIVWQEQKPFWQSREAQAAPRDISPEAPAEDTAGQEPAPPARSDNMAAAPGGPEGEGIEPAAPPRKRTTARRDAGNKSRQR